MNFRKAKVYKQIIKTGIIRSFTYKFEVYSNILMQTIIMIASAYFWKALFKNADSVQGVTVNTMLIYTVVSSMISIVLSSDVEWRIMKSVEKGTIAIDMMRPINVFSIFFAEDIARQNGIFEMRTDTHRKNEAMKKLLRRCGYTYRGNVLVSSEPGHDPKRQAFEKVL